jgi:hypothetical protein
MKRLIVGGALGLVGAVAISRLEGLTMLAHRTAKLGRAVGNRLGDALNVRPLDEVPKEDLYEQAKERDIPGRSTMSKDELIEALEDEA